MDDLSSKISEMFSNPESMEQIRNLIGMLGGGGSGGGPSANTANSANSANNETANSPPPGGAARQSGQRPSGSSGDPGFPFDPAMLMRFQKAFNMLRKDDPRVTFLLALKPNLTETRQRKVDEAIHLLRLFNLLPMLQEELF